MGQSRRMDTPDDLAACPLYLQQLPCPASRRADLNDESGAKPRRLRLAQRIPATGRGAERMSDQTSHRRSGRARTQFANGAKHEASRVDARGSRPRVGRVNIVLECGQLNPTTMRGILTESRTKPSNSRGVTSLSSPTTAAQLVGICPCRQPQSEN